MKSQSLVLATLALAANAKPLESRGLVVDRAACPTEIGWVSKGCYTDSVSARTLTNNGWVPGGPEDVSVETCQKGCTEVRGGLPPFKYAGVEYGGECYCDNVLHGGIPATTGCNMPCKGNKNETCGGPDRLNLYEFVALPAGCPAPKPLVTSKALRDTIKIENLMARAQTLQSIAESDPGYTRVIGSLGHNKTVDYIYNTIAALSDYFTVYKQGFPQSSSLPKQTKLIINGVNSPGFAAEDAPPATGLTAPLYAVPNNACDPADFAGMPAGSIALVHRNVCDRGNKVVLAAQFGAVGALFWNNGPGSLEGLTLPHDSLPGPLVPTIGITQADGQALVARLAAGEAITVSLTTAYYTYLTYNIVAETIGGDHDNVIHICGHSDSVLAGPGINDNGSGSLSLLEIATQLPKFSVKNAVRISWWSAEEEGLLGAYYYVSKLTQAEKDKQRLVLDFDMMASPNYAFQIYDGDSSAFEPEYDLIPAGSAEAEHEFAAYFDSQGLNHTEIAFDGRSDYGPFLEAGIASGGIACGAEVEKTVAEVAMFGGVAGVAYDVNYHSKLDDIRNLNEYAWKVMTDAIAHMTATYAQSFASLPPRKRSLAPPEDSEEGRKGMVAARVKWFANSRWS